MQGQRRALGTAGIRALPLGRARAHWSRPGGQRGGATTPPRLSSGTVPLLKCRKSRKKQPVASISSGGRIGQVGKFKNGALILSQVDIKKINSSRVAR